MKKHLQAIINKYGIAKGRLFDIGCNDGTLIEFADNFGMDVIGIDPSNAVDDIPDKFKTQVFKNFFSLDFCKTELAALNNTFDLVTAISMFYDVSDKEYKNNSRALIDTNQIKEIFDADYGVQEGCKIFKT